jgi:hypothetical protein
MMVERCKDGQKEKTSLHLAASRPQYVAGKSCNPEYFANPFERLRELQRHSAAAVARPREASLDDCP